MKKTSNPFILTCKLILIIAALPLVLAAALIWAAVTFGKAAVQTMIKKSRVTADN